MSSESPVDLDAILRALDVESDASRSLSERTTTAEESVLDGAEEGVEAVEADPEMDSSYFSDILDDLGSSIVDMQASLDDSKPNPRKDESEPVLPVVGLPLADESVVDGANDEEPEDEELEEVTLADVKDAVRDHAKSGRKFGLGGLIAGIKGLRDKEKAKREKKPSLKNKRKERENLQNKAIALQQRLEVATGRDKQKLQAEYDALIIQLKENQADIEAYVSGVAWQSIILTMGASAVARQGLIVAGSTLLATPAALLAVPVAGGIAGFRDAIRARGEGGATKLYQAATQDTVAALTTGMGSAKKGHESEAEFQKNRWQGWKRSPLWLLRKVGAVANDPRARLVQGAYGVTRDRSTLSKFAIGNQWENISSLNETAVTGWVNDNLEKNPQLVMELGRRLNRLGSLTEYGALDIAGEKGSLLSRVAETHNAAFLKALHIQLDAGVRAIAGTRNDEKWQKFLTEWNKHAGYQSAEARKRAERSAKIKGVAASAVGTMMTAGVGAGLAYFVFGDGVQDVQRGADQVQAAIKDEFKTAQDALQDAGGQLPPELQARIPWLQGPQLGDQDFVPPVVGGGQIPPVVDHLQAPWPHDPQMDVPGATVEPSIGPQHQSMVDRVQQSIADMREHARQAKDSADAAAQQIADHQAQVNADTTDIPRHGLDYVSQPAVHAQVVELKTGVPWNDIKQVVSESGIASDGQVAPDTITDGLKDFWKALQPKDFDFNNIDQHAKFFSLDGVKSVSELPVLSDGAVGYHLSDSQLTHLAEWWKEAAQVEHPTDLQQIARDLNGLETGQPMLFDELAKNPRAMQQLLDIANGVPPVAEIVK